MAWGSALLRSQGTFPISHPDPSPKCPNLTNGDIEAQRWPVSGSLPPASQRLTQRRSSSGEWAAGWGPHCPGAGMVSDFGPFGCPAARPKPGGWGAVVAEEFQMTWLTWRDRGLSEAHTLQGGPQRHPPPTSETLPSETQSSHCGMQAAAHSVWRSQSRSQKHAGLTSRSVASPGGLPPSQLCQLLPTTRLPLVPVCPRCPAQTWAPRNH